MYSRGYERGIESDGSLRDYERSLERAETPAAPAEEALAASGECRPKGRGGIGGLFSAIDKEDLLIIAIALLVLTDGDGDNDLLLIALAFLLLF